MKNDDSDKELENIIVTREEAYEALMELASEMEGDAKKRMEEIARYYCSIMY